MEAALVRCRIIRVDGADHEFPLCFIKILIPTTASPSQTFRAASPPGRRSTKRMLMAPEAIELYLEILVDDGREIPDASEIDQLLRDNPDYADGIWAIVAVEYRRLANHS